MRGKILLKLSNYKKYGYIIIAILLQRIYLNYLNLEFLNGAYTVNGVQIFENISATGQLLTIWFLPVYFIFNVFSGKVSDALTGYGTLLIVRDYKKSKLVLKAFIKIMLELALILILQIVVFYIGTFNFGKSSIYNIFLRLILYFLTFLTLILIQVLLENYVDSKISTIIVSIYIILSVMASNFNYMLHCTNKFLHYLFIPNYAMAYRNGLICSKYNIVHYDVCLITLLLLIPALLYIEFRLIQKKDII